jgi:hypothetical protein
VVGDNGGKLPSANEIRGRCRVGLGVIENMKTTWNLKLDSEGILGIMSFLLFILNVVNLPYSCTAVCTYYRFVQIQLLFSMPTKFNI